MLWNIQQITLRLQKGNHYEVIKNLVMAKEENEEKIRTLFIDRWCPGSESNRHGSISSEGF